MDTKPKKSKFTIRFKKIFGDNVTEKKDIAKLTGVPIQILDEVFDRGMKAWESSHRFGVAQQQWATARMYSFLTLGKTHFTTDNDLADEAKRKVKARKYFTFVEQLLKDKKIR